MLGLEACRQTGQADRHFGRERAPCGCGEARILAGARFVIRYDHRDAGRSATCPPRRPGYTVVGLVADAAGVPGAYGVPAAHVVGVPAGRVLMQRLALDYPRVRSLVLISTLPRPLVTATARFRRRPLAGSAKR